MSAEAFEAIVFLSVVATCGVILVLWGTSDGQDQRRMAARITLLMPLWAPVVIPIGFIAATYMTIRWLIHEATAKGDDEW